jgi:hypothetical protein
MRRNHGEINWFATLLIGAVLSIPFGILTNLLSHRFENVLARRSVSAKRKTLKTLYKERERTIYFHDHPEEYVRELLVSILDGFKMLLGAIVLRLMALVLYQRWILEPKEVLDMMRLLVIPLVYGGGAAVAYGMNLVGECSFLAHRLSHYDKWAAENREAIAQLETKVQAKANLVDE